MIDFDPRKRPRQPNVEIVRRESDDQRTTDLVKLLADLVDAHRRSGGR